MFKADSHWLEETPDDGVFHTRWFATRLVDYFYPFRIQWALMEYLLKNSLNIILEISKLVAT